MNTCLIQTAHNLLAVPQIRRSIDKTTKRPATPAKVDRQMEKTRRQGRKL